MANETVLELLRRMRNDSVEVATADPSLLKAAANVDKIISPILYIFGFPGNLIAIIIWLQPRMRHSSGTYLAALGFVDLLFMVIHVMFEIYKVWGVQMFDAPGICELLPVVYMATQYLSPLLVLGFTVERFIGVQFPSKRQIYCTINRARIASFALALFALAIGSMQGYIYKYNSKLDFCGLREAAVRGGHASLWSIWTWITEMLVFMCVPMLILMFNVMIIRRIRNLAEIEKSYSSKALTTTFSLLVVSFYFIITTFPVSIIYAIRYYYVPSEDTVAGDPQKQAQYMLAKTIIEEIGTTHHACKFYIFLITEQAFRAEFLRVVAKVLPISRDKIGYEQQTEVTANTEWHEAEMGEVGVRDETDM
ncbi:proteinase-activated receptor 1-like [Ruditapes philippinarum]|uniref:proteinase-activated receptor 1-like n=1 Tax=Ruditapes philippinarum TaxID=129788 RepID=UPI00295A8408|nr:proteinase-activated receptor 1-like [Ruditapes philippinarum]XP_060554827.1 proteinase-activated receptor 1-like [Ruditapes philippinarum]XP_060554828.1 proteinase-activated receptor 1-like [Ruditapes philippinarum]XP_060554829.1 proteinase-activated receptor 1-like [Ruditapes philippinarum]